MKRIAGRVPVFAPEPPLGGSLEHGYVGRVDGDGVFTRRENSDQYDKGHNDVLPSSLREANVFTSKIKGDPKGRHMLAVDIDAPVQVFDSSHPGHHHLYIEKPMSWDNYELLLIVLAQCGLIETGYLKASQRRGFTALRLPWIRKSHNARWARKARRDWRRAGSPRPLNQSPDAKRLDEVAPYPVMVGIADAWEAAKQYDVEKGVEAAFGTTDLAAVF